MNRSRINIGYIYILVSTLAFASYGVWAKMIGDTYGVFTQAWTRALLICVVLLAIGLITKQFKKFENADIKWVVIYTAFSIFTVAPIYYAFTQMGIGTATILFYAAYMVASYVIGRIFFAEKITIAKIAAMICAVIGMIMVFGIELAGVSALALSMAILNGVASGGEVSFTKKVSDRYSVLQLTFVTWVVIFIVHFIFAVFQNETLLPVQTPMSIIGILLFATTAMLAYWLVVAGYKTIEAGIGGLIGTLEVPFAVILGALFFAEQLAPIAIVGGALIFIAAAIPDGVDIIRRRQLRQTAIK